jgi:hypothetical protein
MRVEVDLYGRAASDKSLPDLFREWVSIPTVERRLWQTLLAEAVDFARRELST